jgi:hypothetical protein
MVAAVAPDQSPAVLLPSNGLGVASNHSDSKPSRKTSEAWSALESNRVRGPRCLTVLRQRDAARLRRRCSGRARRPPVDARSGREQGRRAARSAGPRPRAARSPERSSLHRSPPSRSWHTEVARHDRLGLLAQECPPGRGRRPRRGIEPATAKRGADRGCRNVHAEPLKLALAALVAPARILPGQADDQLLGVLVQRWSSCWVVRVGPRPGGAIGGKISPIETQ